MQVDIENPVHIIGRELKQGPNRQSRHLRTRGYSQYSQARRSLRPIWVFIILPIVP